MPAQPSNVIAPIGAVAHVRADRDPLAASAAHVGPNAVIQAAAALRRGHGDRMVRELFDAAGMSDWVERPPRHMIPEADAARLFDAIRTRLGAEQSETVLEAAGIRTGAYILAHRIPPPARRLVAALPAPIGARLLLAAVVRHAWTFAGSGAVRGHYGMPLALEITRNPLATPGCPWHLAVLHQLFSVLVTPDITVRHVACCAWGDGCCRSEIVIGHSFAPGRSS